MALGFYGIDIGEFGGELSLRTTTVGGANTLLNVPNTVGSAGSTDGSVLFFGLIETDPLQAITSVEFLTSTGQQEAFGFDDFSVGTPQQLLPIPEPTAVLTWAGLSACLLALCRPRQG